MLVLLQAEGADVGGPIVGIIIALLVVLCVFNSIYFIKEKETVVIEFLGHFSKVLHSGPHFVFWPLYRPKTYRYVYFSSILLKLTS